MICQKGKRVHRSNGNCRLITIEGIQVGDHTAKCPICNATLKGTKRWIKKQVRLCERRTCPNIINENAEEDEE